MNHINVDKTLCVGASYQYSRVQAWFKLVFPQMFGQLRLPIYAVLSYSLSVVDLSVVLGPTAPPTFAVLITQWFNDADLSYRLMAASGASLLLLIVILSICLIYALELLVKRMGRQWLVRGPSCSGKANFQGYHASVGVLSALMLLTYASIAALLVWSVAQQWRFPDGLPALWSLKYWYKSAEQLIQALSNTAVIGVVSAAIALLICIVVLQWQSRNELKRTGVKNRGGRSSSLWIIGLIYFPILVPQVAFLFGVQILLVSLKLEGLMVSVIWSHLIFVLPYVYLSLAKSYLSYDERYLQAGSMLSGSDRRAFFYIKLPMLLKPLCFSFAIGFAVSVSQYLPSLYVGAGRINTLTLESVALASGSDLRITAVFALWQFLLPLLVYLLAMYVPKYLYRNYRSM